MNDLIDRMAVLRRDGQSFAVATVVARRSPVSSHLGDRALVFTDGRMEGFVGGACSCEIVRREALEALRTRRARLISIRPDAEDHTDATGEHVVVTMRCASEGAVDVFVEPFVQARRLVVVGATPVAHALVRLAQSLDYDVVWVVDAHARHAIEPQGHAFGARVVEEAELDAALRVGGGEVAGVVAAQSHDDDSALERMLKSGASYVGLIASRTRGAAIRAALEARDVPGVASIHSPAGLDLGARIPAEVALSVLAEIVKCSPSLTPAHGTTCGAQAVNATSERDGTPLAATDPSTHASVSSSPATASETTSAAGGRFALDPVCGMQVDVASARHVAELEGVNYYFCCPHCRAEFVASPSQFLPSHA
jgi:xanthine dehydrogenase accessory factor